jgi:phosphohistidine swiveling domain-containing protein
VRDPREVEDLNGDILVTSSTDPGWVTLFPTASAILVERGSLLSHSAIVSREMGKPCIVGITGLLDRLKTGDVVEMDKITKTVYFIFLAPLIGMLISIFITLVTIRRNVYGRLVLITLSAVGLWFLFGTFRVTKLEENLTKFYKLDKYKKELAKNPNDEAVIKKYDKAKANYDLSKPYLKNFDAEGADKVADKITAVVDVKYLEESKIKDVVSKKLKIDKYKKDAFYDASLQPLCDAATATLDECKPIIKNYHTVGLDSTAKALTLEIGIDKIGDYDKFTKSLTVDTKKDLKKELGKADNRTLLYCIAYPSTLQTWVILICVT